MAILAGDALQPAAYALISQAEQLDVKARLDCTRILAQASGADGMVGGQVLDTLHETTNQAQLQQVHQLKTGAMMVAAAQMGCAAAGASEQWVAMAGEYAAQLGMAFQIRDDMLDIIGNEEQFGKPIGSDQEAGKVTFVDLLGLEGCSKAVADCTEMACNAVSEMENNEFICHLASQLAKRSK